MGWASSLAKHLLRWRSLCRGCRFKWLGLLSLGNQEQLWLSALGEGHLPAFSLRGKEGAVFPGWIYVVLVIDFRIYDAWLLVSRPQFGEAGLRRRLGAQGLLVYFCDHSE